MITELKAKAFDILVQLEQIKAAEKELNTQLAAVVAEINNINKEAIQKND
jgi:seryl-tRNA synthetase